MDQATQEDMGALLTKDTWTVEDRQELLRVLSLTNDGASKLRAMCAKLEAETPDAKGSAALKIGIARYVLCRFGEALDVLATATDNKDRRYFQALCHKNLHQYDKAAEEFERAADRGFDANAVQAELVEVKALAGDLDGASKMLAKLASKIGQTAAYFYLKGLAAELSGSVDEAEESYEKVRSLDPGHTGATFRLAYCCDLHGDEERAVQLYRECASKPPVHANALLNLAVLYEDAGRYDDALACLHSILATNPAHARARLFLRDCESAKTMYYDEDQAKRIARRNAVLDIPVTDFELSVRARNCLKKMNIYTLGDLVRTTEPDLLSYKNFGETSLKEIKDMLAAKGLHLGQALEEEGDIGLPVRRPSALSVGDQGVLATPIEQIEFSVRSRRALQGLNIATLGELAAQTEAELLACRNFGQTSLNEVRQRLAEYGLQLSEPN